MNKLPFEQIQRKILVKKESTTNEDYGKRPEDRTTKELLGREIIKTEVLEELFEKEQADLSINANICIGSRAYFTISSKDRKITDIKEDDLLIIRCIKNKIMYEYIGNVGIWGKINIPLEIVKKLGIKNHEEINIKLIKNNPFSTEQTSKQIDLTRTLDVKIINRNEKYITIYKKQQMPITLPRFIEVKSDLIEALYLLHGDGRYKDKTFFTNINPELHRFIITVFEKELGIPKALWKARVNHCNRKLVDKSIRFWNQELGINKEIFYNTRKLSKFNTKNYGDLRIIIDNLIISNVIKYLLDNIKLNRDYTSLIALNGILDAEGSAKIGKKGLHKITISFSQKEKNMFQDILEISNLDIFQIEQNSRFCIRSWEKQYKFIKKFLDNNLMPFNKHIERKFNTVYGFLEHRYTKTLRKYIENIEEGKNQKELAEKMRHRVDSILNMVNKERYRQFISLKDKRITLTPEGKEFFNVVTKLEIQLQSTKKEYEGYLKPIEKFNREVKNEIAI